jgi:hypothetical protein
MGFKNAMDKKNSRLSFLKAGLLVGGALYADPAAALARSGGRMFPMQIEPAKDLYPPSTEISYFIPGSYLPGNTGSLTLKDFAGLAELDVSVLDVMFKKFPSLTLGDIGDCVAYAIDVYGTGQTLFGEQSGEKLCFACCCCCCCKTVTFGGKGQ